MASQAHILRLEGAALNSFLLFVDSIGVSVYGGADCRQSPLADDLWLKCGQTAPT